MLPTFRLRMTPLRSGYAHIAFSESSTGKTSTGVAHYFLRLECLNDTQKCARKLLRSSSSYLLISRKIPEPVETPGAEVVQGVPHLLRSVAQLPVSVRNKPIYKGVELLCCGEPVELDVGVNLGRHAFQILCKRLWRPFVLGLTFARTVSAIWIPLQLQPQLHRRTNGGQDCQLSLSAHVGRTSRGDSGAISHAVALSILHLARVVLLMGARSHWRSALFTLCGILTSKESQGPDGIRHQQALRA